MTSLMNWRNPDEIRHNDPEICDQPLHAKCRVKWAIGRPVTIGADSYLFRLHVQFHHQKKEQFGLSKARLAGCHSGGRKAPLVEVGNWGDDPNTF